MVKSMQFAAETRQKVDISDSPSLKSEAASTASKIEREYVLWCGYHGKKPTLLPPPDNQQAKVFKEPKPESRASRHGGRREGAGRKALGKKQLLIRVRPGTVKRLKELVKKMGFETPGEWLAAELAKTL